jgi:iron complex transport system ATP-binding protein
MRLELCDLRLARGGRPVLTGVSAAFEPGTVTAVLGPNGAGKSTLLEAMAGLLAPAAGEIRLDGVPLAALPARARARAIGYLPQGATLHWNLTVADVVALGRTPHVGAFAAASAADRDAVARAMAAADVDSLARRRALDLSGGERARVLLARVLAGEPRVLLADEPLANLDPRHQLEALRLLRGAADAGAAVVLVLHDLAAAARAADRLILLAGGRVLGDGQPADVLTAALLAEAYGVEMRVWSEPGVGLIVAPQRFTDA